MNLAGYKFDANSTTGGNQAVGVSVTYPAFAPLTVGGTYNGGAGGFTGTLSNAGLASLPTGTFNIDTYCVQLGEYFSPGSNYNYDVITPASSYFTPDGDVRSNRLAKLFSHVYATGGGNPFDTASTEAARATLSAAVQLAVWEIKYETDLAALSLGDGLFKWTSTGDLTGVYATANQLLNNSKLSAVTVDLYVLESLAGGKQDQVFWRHRVPEPASLSLAMLAFAAAGVATRRRKPVQA